MKKFAATIFAIGIAIFAFLTPVSAQDTSLPFDFRTSGPIAASSQVVTLPTNGRSTVGISVTGTWSGSLTIRVSVDYAQVGAANATWGTSTAVSLASGTVVTSISSNGIFQVNASGFSAVQVFGTNIVSGTANVSMEGSTGVSTVMADNPFPVASTTVYPLTATPVTGTGTGSTGAISATLSAGTTQVTYLCGFSFQGSNATAAVNSNISVTGLSGGTLNFGYTALAAGAAVPQPPPITHRFNPCLPSSAVNTAVVVTPPTLGAGAPLATVTVWGFRL